MYQTKYSWHELILKSLNNAVRTEHRNPSQYLPISLLPCLPFHCFPRSHGSQLQFGGGGTGSHQCPGFLAGKRVDGNDGGFLLFVGRRKTMMLITSSFLAWGPPEFIFIGFLSKVCLHAPFFPHWFPVTQFFCFLSCL